MATVALRNRQEGTAESARLRRLEALHERQLVGEQRMKAALEEVTNELGRLQENNSKRIKAAELEMMQLTEGLQRSLQERSVLEVSLQQMEFQVVDLANRRGSLQAACGAVEEELHNTLAEMSEAQSSLAAAREEKENLLQALEEQRRAVQGLAAESSAGAAEAAALESEAQLLRKELGKAARRDLAEERARAARACHLTREVFLRFVVAARASKKENAFLKRTRSRCLQESGILLKSWHQETLRLAALRRLEERVDQATLLVALEAWISEVVSRRWLKRQSPEAVAFCQQRQASQAFGLWRQALAAALREELWPWQSRMLKHILLAWQKESCAMWWGRWREARCTRRHMNQLLRRAFRAFGAFYSQQREQQLMLSKHVMQVRRKAVFLRWSRQHRPSTDRWTLRRVWWAFRVNVKQSLLERKKISRLLLLSWRGLKAWACHAGELRQRCLRRHLREGLCVAKNVLPAWLRAAAKQSKLRGSRALFQQQVMLRRLACWQSWARDVRQRKRRDLQALDLHLAARRRRILGLMAQVSRRLRRHRECSVTVSQRRDLSLCQLAWSSWLRLLRTSLLLRRQELSQEHLTAKLREDEVQSVLREAVTRSSSSELMRLRLVDELHAAAERTAQLLVESQDATSANMTLREALTAEHAAERRLKDEASELRSELADAEARQASRHAVLEEELGRALAAPVALRTAIRDCEAAAARAYEEEAEAQQEADTLKKDLEELHILATQKLRSKEREVSEMHQQVTQSRLGVQEMQEALLQQQLVLRSREDRFEELRAKDTSRYLDMVT